MSEKLTSEMRERILERARKAPKAKWIFLDKQDRWGEELGHCSICGNEVPRKNFCGKCGATFLSEGEIANKRLKGDDDE